MAELENKTAPEKKPNRSGKPSVFSRLASWFKSLRSESKKISWASFESVRKNTIIVLVCVVIFSISLGIIDYLLSGAIVGLGRLL